MSVPFKLAGFAAALGALFGIGALAGAVVDPGGVDAAAKDEAGHGEKMEMTGSHGAAMPVRGLAVAEGGLRLIVDTPELQRGRPERIAFRIVDTRGRTVRNFDVEHTKRMHLILARRDLTGFQHLHPEQRADGSWTTTARLDDAGSYRLFADFSRAGKPRTLASDLRVDGSADLQPLPAPEATANSGDGYAVRLDSRDVRAGREAELAFTVTKNGRPIKTEQYLGAGGHLVALREGDLAFLHVHPQDDGVRFEATFPTTGRYRLFLQFQHEGRVHTVAFTQEVA